MQDKYKMGLNASALADIKQPDTELAAAFETTYTSDTKRSQTGAIQLTPMFTVEAFTYQATGVTKAEMSQILQIIAKGNKFYLHYFSPYWGTWRTDQFYVGQGQLAIGTLEEDGEKYSSLSFQMTGCNPI